MKFEEHLLRHAIPEWRASYLDYSCLKKLIDAVDKTIKHDKLGPVSAEERTRRENLECVQQFQMAVSEQLNKVNKFYLEKEEEAEKKFTELKGQLTGVKMIQRNGKSSVANVLSVRSEKKTNLAHMRRVFEEYYRTLDMLKTYRDLNMTGFRKITKKFDKNSGLHLQEEFMIEAHEMEFARSQRLKVLTSNTEKLYIAELMHGDRTKAMRRLRIPETRFEPMDWQTLRLGFYAGTFIFTCIILIIATGLVDRANYPELSSIFIAFRGLLLPGLFITLLSIDSYVWSNFQVNFVLIFGLNPRRFANYRTVAEIGGGMLTIWCIFVLVYTFRKETGIAEVQAPAALAATYLILLVQPLDVLYRRERYWFLKVLGRIAAAPFTHVNFEDFWLTDQFNSFVLFLLDMEFLICFAVTNDSDSGLCSGTTYGLRPILACIPAYWRFMQCWRRWYDTRDWFPHLVNAGKYSTTFLVVLTSSLAADSRGTDNAEFDRYVAMWIVAAIINTAYTFVWDVKMDWHLFEKNSKHMFLKDKLVYHPNMYYTAIVINFILRCAWTVAISVGFFGVWFADGLVAVLAVAEMMRRCMWNFFRLEAEHLNNVGQFRAVREIPLPFEYLASDETSFGEDDYGVDIERLESPRSTEQKTQLLTI